MELQLRHKYQGGGEHIDERLEEAAGMRLLRMQSPAAEGGVRALRTEQMQGAHVVVCADEKNSP